MPFLYACYSGFLLVRRKDKKHKEDHWEAYTDKQVNSIKELKSNNGRSFLRKGRYQPPIKYKDKGGQKSQFEPVREDAQKADYPEQHNLPERYCKF